MVAVGAVVAVGGGTVEVGGRTDVYAGDSVVNVGVGIGLTVGVGAVNVGVVMGVSVGEGAVGVATDDTNGGGVGSLHATTRAKTNELGPYLIHSIYFSSIPGILPLILSLLVIRHPPLLAFPRTSRSSWVTGATYFWSSLISSRQGIPPRAGAFWGYQTNMFQQFSDVMPALAQLILRAFPFSITSWSLLTLIQ